MIAYSTYFKHLILWCYRTAALQFAIFLLLFLLVSYLSTLLEISESTDNETVFISKYEKYIVLALSLYMIVPFGISNLILFGLFHKHQLMLTIAIRVSIMTCVVILVVMIGSGIFLAVKGTAYVAYSLIGCGLVLEIFMLHSILLIAGAKEEFLREDDQIEEASANSDSFEEIQ